MRLKNLHSGTPYATAGGRETAGKSKYNLLDANLVGLLLRIDHGPLQRINHREKDVVYSFHRFGITLKPKTINKRTAEGKPELLKFFSKFYGQPIEDMGVYGGEIRFSGVHPDMSSIPLQDFQNNELVRYMFFDRGIDPSIALWFLNAGYADPVTVKYIRDGNIVIDVGAEVILRENKFKDRINKFKNTLGSIGISTSLDTPIKELEKNVKKYCLTRIEYLVKVNDIPYEGSNLLNAANGLELLEALSKVEIYSEHQKKIKLKSIDGTSLPERMIQTSIGEQGLTTEIVLTEEFFGVKSSDRISRELGKNPF